jgi:hypothetical protein
MASTPHLTVGDAQAFVIRIDDGGHVNAEIDIVRPVIGRHLSVCFALLLNPNCGPSLLVIALSAPNERVHWSDWSGSVG